LATGGVMQAQNPNVAARDEQPLPPRVVEAQRFLARRGLKRGGGLGVPRRTTLPLAGVIQPQDQAQLQSSATWLPLGPAAVQSLNYGLVAGRVSALSLDPSDASGNTLYVGTAGGGVWRSQNADTADATTINFLPITDNLPALHNVTEASVSIGALTVQPGGTGVILAGTGDPNDALDSYYGAGILRSTDGGASWTLIPGTSDGLYSFDGEGFAGFAWSTANTQLVVAAVSQAYEGTLVNAVYSGSSYEGLYYSQDGGASWSLAAIADGSGKDVQGPNDVFAPPDGNAATAVVWNPARQLFVAAVRYHGYYQSADGVTWTRIAAQPGSGLTAQLCPANTGETGSPGCPIFRGTLAVNPQTGDTFAWAVDRDDQDQGLWQDKCAATAGVCASTALWTASQIQRWDTTALETDTPLGSATIANGDYNLTLAALPAGLGQQYGTVVLAGANDLWKSECPYSQGCAWRNTTNSTVGFCAQVGEYQHALEWNAANPQEILVGNDSGLWRSTDSIAETGPLCSASDATHFQNLNGNLGPLTDVASLSQIGATPYTIMAGLGADGTAGVKSTTGPTTTWPEILGGEGGPVQIDPNNASNWYVNNQPGVSIYLCSQQSLCNQSNFGSAPVVSDADVGEDGLTMTEPAPFLIDPLDSSKLLIGTCRLWRGAANGTGWTSANAISPMLDGSKRPYCNGDALIRSMAALALPSGKEAIYVGMYGSADGGSTLPGHVLTAIFDPASATQPVWTDLTVSPVTNDTNPMNLYGLDISSIVIDPHDATGKTAYVTVAGIENRFEKVEVLYGTTDGGAHWTALTSNLFASPANSLVVDPKDPSTVYLATDAGVYSTRQIASCGSASPGCWSAFGSGLPLAPVVELHAGPSDATVQNLVAATHGRGIWMAPLWTAGETPTTATVTPASLTFASQSIDSSSAAQTVTVENTGSAALAPTSVVASGDFSETDNCLNATIAAGASCAIQVVFTPTQTGSRTGTLTIDVNVSGGELTVSLNGAGTPPGTVTLSPASINFGSWQVGMTSTALQVTAINSSPQAVPFTSALTGPFAIASNACGASIPANGSCNLMLTFTPTQAGTASGALTFTDSIGTQTVDMSGTGLAAPTDDLSPASLTFPSTVVGQPSAAQTLTLANGGGEPLTSIAISVSGPFQQTNACTANLAPQSECGIGVVYAPTQTGSQTGTLTVSDLLRTQTVPLSGTGIAAAVIAANPASLSFAAQLVGVASAPQTLTVGNTGGSPMANVGFQITGISATSFSTGPTTCAATLANGSSCTVQVIFTPAVSGAAMASLGISSSTPGVAPLSVPLSGTEQASAGVNVNPAQLTFGIVLPGQSSAAQTVTITNNGISAVTSMTLAATAPFSLAQTACGASLAAGASCSASVVFSPGLAVPYSGTLTLTTAAQTPAIVLLSGTGGTPGAVQARPSQVGFPQTSASVVSAPVTVTLTNPAGDASLANFAVAVTAGFKLVNNTCPSTLAAAASCTVDVEFDPASAGAQTGTLTAGSSVLASGVTVPLSGMGFDFAVCFGNTTSPCVISSSQTVASGQTADYQLAIAPLAGALGALTLQCGNLPSNSTCNFNGDLVQVATGVATSARLARPASWPGLPLTCGLVLVPLAFWKRRKALALIALIAILVGGVSSCTSSGGGVSRLLPNSGLTPAGTYSIPVTVTSSGIEHQVTLTLTVD